MNTPSIRRRASRWREHDAAVPYREHRRRGASHVETSAVNDTTGRPAGYFGAKLGKRISWQAFRNLTRTPKGATGGREMVPVALHRYVNSATADALDLAPIGDGYPAADAVMGRPKGCAIPEGATLRPRKPRRNREPKQEEIYWLGRKARFPKRYTDPTKQNRGFPKRPILVTEWPLSALLRPLSAKATARHYVAPVAVPMAAKPHPVARRNPISEEIISGRIDGRLTNAADWFEREILATANAKVDGVRIRSPSGAMVSYGSRNPLDLWPAEASADRAIRLRLRFRTLGPLARIVWRALNGAEMADLAPAWPFPQRHRAEAGRIRLRAGLELCARMAERDVDSLPQWEVLQVVQSACAECAKLEATRRMRVLVPANDNNRMQAVS